MDRHKLFWNLDFKVSSSQLRRPAFYF